MAAMPVRKRVAAYARVSSGKDAMLHSLAAQVSHYSALIQQRPEWEYAGVYADEALTGTKGDRAEFQRLVADCRAGLIDMVITKSISRFARNTVTLLETVRELKALGIGVRFEEQGIDTLTADGELMLTILASYAQEESRSASENQKWRIRKDYRDGIPSNHICIYGYEYDNGALTVIPEEADVVRMIFSDYLGGMGLYAIAKKLTQSGVPTKKGGQWSYPAIADILKNEKYAGVLLLQKGFITDHLTKRHKRNKGELPQYYIKDHHEPIIGIEAFNAVQAEMARRSARMGERREPAESEFSGLIRCGRCGAAFCRKISAADTKYAKPVWACRTYTHFGKDFCPAKRIPEDILKEKCAEALGLTKYDPEALNAKVREITVPGDGVLTFVFNDGTEVAVTWQHRSRSESWTDEMREEARRKAKEVRNDV
jgi:DNA invertase Pin-like site-specific DNA recombinase